MQCLLVMHHPVELSAKIAGKASALRATLVGKGGIFKRLIEEHAAISVLLARIQKSSDPDLKRDLYALVRRELLAHTKAEEREFYSELRQHDRTRTLSEVNLREHEHLEDLIDRLSATPVIDPSWDVKLAELSSAIEAHVQREEHELFEEATKIIDRGEARRIERRFLQRKHDELDSLP
jgi:hemerythrin superfamily protein